MTSKSKGSVELVKWVSDAGEREWGRMSSHMTTGREYRPPRRHQKVSSCVPPRLPVRGQPRTTMGPDMIEEYVSNSVAVISGLLHPKTFVAPAETLGVVDM